LRQHPELHIRIIEMTYGDAFYWPCPDGTQRCAIALGAHLDQAGRRCALTHELVHHERGGGCSWSRQPDSWAVVVARDEAAVDQEVARRLVPVDQLRDLVTLLTDFGEGVEARHVAEEFDVTVHIAEIALRLLALGRRLDRRAG
jgi:hypothetical protein